MTRDLERRERFEAVVAEVQDPLERYLRRRASVDDVDDLLGDVLLTVWRRLDDLPPAAVLPWCYGVARRALANQRRGTRRRLRLVERLTAEPASAVTMEESAAAEDPELAAALEALPAADREILVLWAWEGLEPRDVAVVLDITPNAAALRLSRAKKRLSAELTRQDSADAGHEGIGDTGGHRP